MKDEELRAFLESAEVGDDDTQAMVVLPPAPNEKPVGERAPSFDELIDRGMSGEGEGADDESPIVLPTPPASGQRSARQYPTQPVVAPIATSAPAPAAPPTAVPAASSEPVSVAPLAETAPIPAGLASVDTQAFGPSGAALTEADYEPIAVTGGSGQPRRVLPWLIVVGGAVVALLAAIFIVGSLTSDREPAAPPAASPSPTEGTSGSGSPSPSAPSGNGSGGDEGEPGDETPTEPGSEVPSVDVGPTQGMDIVHWNTQVDLSQKLGLSVQYMIMGENLELSSQLINSYVEVCGGSWGMTRVADGEFAVLKPAERCAAQPEVYDELWGLLDAMVESARPL